MIEELRVAYGARTLLASVDARNAASIALLRALGFRQDRIDGSALVFSSTA